MKQNSRYTSSSSGQITKINIGNSYEREMFKHFFSFLNFFILNPFCFQRSILSMVYLCVLVGLSSMITQTLCCKCPTLTREQRFCNSDFSQYIVIQNLYVLWKDLKDVKDTYSDFNEYINLVMILNPSFLNKKKDAYIIAQFSIK